MCVTEFSSGACHDEVIILSLACHLSASCSSFPFTCIKEERRLLSCFVLEMLSVLASFESERLFNKNGESLSLTFK